jgi:uncharacterized protein YecE (DUF72 family)
VHRFGTVGIHGAPRRTFATLGLVEYEESFRGDPSTRSLARLRAAAPPSFEFVVRASLALCHGSREPSARGVRLPYLPGPLPTTALTDASVIAAAWEHTQRVATALGARCIFLQTPTGFRPTAPNLGRLRALAHDFCSCSGLAIAWEPLGLFTPEEHLAVCDALGWIPCLDPLLVETLPPGRELYLRVIGPARRDAPLPQEALQRIAAALSDGRPARVVFATPHAYKDALALLRFEASV